MHLTDAQWSVLQPLFLRTSPQPPHKRNRGRPACSDRSVLDAILWVRRTGSPWRDLPPGYPSYLTCHRRELEWTCSGLMRRILAALIDDLHHRGGFDLSRLIPDGLVTARQRGRTYHIAVHPDLIGTWQLDTAMIFLIPHLKQLARRRRLKVVYGSLPSPLQALDT